MGAEQILYHHNGSGFFTIIIGAEKILCQLYKKADALSSLWKKSRSFIIIMVAVPLPSFQEHSRSSVIFTRKQMLYHHYGSRINPLSSLWEQNKSFIIIIGAYSLSSLWEQILFPHYVSRSLIIEIVADLLSLSFSKQILYLYYERSRLFIITRLLE